MPWFYLHGWKGCLEYQDWIIDEKAKVGRYILVHICSFVVIFLRAKTLWIFHLWEIGNCHCLDRKRREKPYSVPNTKIITWNANAAVITFSNDKQRKEKQAKRTLALNMRVFSMSFWTFWLLFSAVRDGLLVNFLIINWEFVYEFEQKTSICHILQSTVFYHAPRVTFLIKNDHVNSGWWILIILVIWGHKNDHPKSHLHAW